MTTDHIEIKKEKKKRHNNNNINIHICIQSYARYYHPAAISVCASCQLMECAHTDRRMYRAYIMLTYLCIYTCVYMSIIVIFKMKVL